MCGVYEQFQLQLIQGHTRMGPDEIKARSRLLIEDASSKYETPFMGMSPNF